MNSRYILLFLLLCVGVVNAQKNTTASPGEDYTMYWIDQDGDGYGNENVSHYWLIGGHDGWVLNDDDCDDEDFNINIIRWYRDIDQDGYGDPLHSVVACGRPSIYFTTNNQDCDDHDANSNPNVVWYLDNDHDGLGGTTILATQCAQPANGVTNNTDCDDNNPALSTPLIWYADADGDGFGENATVQACTQPTGYVANHLDQCPGVNGPISGCLVPATNFNGENYILTINPRVPVTDVQQITDSKDVAMGITYFDGIGRAIQTVSNKQSNNQKDVATLTKYDAHGRVSKEFLPFVSTQNNLAYINELTLESGTQSQYQTSYGTTVAFNERAYESSPLSRVIKEAAPGADWAMGSGHEVKKSYQINTAADAVKQYASNSVWSADELYVPALTQSGNYPAGELQKEVTYDENNTALLESAGSTVEFKDREGHVVLKRTYGTVASGTTNVNYDTYYVYDQFGNLSFVIPPAVTNAITQLDAMCYQYRYDVRNRLVEKRIPGKQWEFMIYDKLDRLIATGPTLPPFSDLVNSGWSITKYDAFNRPVISGWKTSAATFNSTARKNVQNSLPATISETKLAPGAPDTTSSGVSYRYTNSAYPNSGYHILKVTYYDDYDFPHAPTTIPGTIEGQPVFYNATVKPVGLETGSWSRATKTTSAYRNLASYILYDEKARPVRVFNRNHENSPGGFNQVDTKFDFAGRPEYTVTLHKRINSDAGITVRDVFTYNHQNLIATHTQQINTGTIQLIAENTYDDLGSLVSKKVGNTASAPLQKIDYSYNIRGWMTGINNDPTNNIVLNASENDLFAFKINYNNVALSQNNYSGQALYNGNISETYWRTAGDNLLRKYSYLYDNLNRLRHGVYERPDSPGFINSYNEWMTYDRNGNILTLERNGDSDVTFPVIKTDNLTYTYDTTSTNQLMKVTDTENNPSGFKDDSNGFNDTSNDYGYDSNGNITSDENKGITQITYNHLNLPVKITFGTTGNIEYLYDANGQKIEKIVTIGSTVTTTKYLGGFQYVNNVLSFFSHKEGYVSKTGSVYKYVFNHTDHLGNIRLSFQDTNGDGQIATGEILEESHYYPFGLKQSGYNTNNTQPQYKYKYNGKEFQDELGLNFYDFGARNYDPAIGRFLSLDRLAEKFEDLTPYQYAGNTPTYFIDMNGEYIYINDPTEKGKQYRYQNGETQQKVDGKWQTIDANTVLSDFVLNTVAGLNTLENSGKTGKGLIDKFSGSDKDVTFEYKKNGAGHLSGIISLDHKNPQSTFVKTTAGIERQESPYFVTIGHEMAHAQDPVKVNFMDTWYRTSSGDEVTKREIYASHYENMIRAEAGLPLRTHYGEIYNPRTKSFKPEPRSRLIDKFGNSVYYGHGNTRGFPGASINDGLRADGGAILKNRFNYNDKE